MRGIPFHSLELELEADVIRSRIVSWVISCDRIYNKIKNNDYTDFLYLKLCVQIKIIFVVLFNFYYFFKFLKKYFKNNL